MEQELKIYSLGEHTRGGSVTENLVCEDKAKLEEYEVWFLGRYHPAGYGSTTRLTQIKPDADKYANWYKLETYRYTSCD